MSDLERIGDLKHTLEQVLGSYKKANERIAELEVLVKRMDEDNKCFEDICADATALIGYERDDAHALTTFLTQYISDKDKRIAELEAQLRDGIKNVEILISDMKAMEKLLNKVPHFHSEYNPEDRMDIRDGQDRHGQCAGDCPACQWEKLRDG